MTRPYESLFSLFTVSAFSILGAACGGDSEAMTPAGSGGAKAPQTSTSANMTTAGSGAAASTEHTFRITELFLRDPHLIVEMQDITDQSTIGASINGVFIKNSLTMDFNNDGFVDNALVLRLRSSQSDASGNLALSHARCKPSDLKHCTPGDTSEININSPTEQNEDGECLAPIAQTTATYSPKLAIPAGPCFASTKPHDILLNLGGIKLKLQETRVAATNPTGQTPSKLMTGLLAGFLTEEASKEAVLPAYVPRYAGKRIGDYIPETDRDTRTGKPDSATPKAETGYWVYLNFVAEQIELQAQ